jgi:hypothetical protein
MKTDKQYLQIFLLDSLILFFFSEYYVLGDLLFVSSNGIICLKCSCFTGFSLGSWVALDTKISPDNHIAVNHNARCKANYESIGEVKFDRWLKNTWSISVTKPGYIKMNGQQGNRVHKHTKSVHSKFTAYIERASKASDKSLTMPMFCTRCIYQNHVLVLLKYASMSITNTATCTILTPILR